MGTGLKPSVYPFLGGRQLSDGDDNRSAFAFIGPPLGSPSDTAGVNSPATDAPDHVRNMLWEQGYPGAWHHYDFDIDGPLMPLGADPDLIDYGDIVGDPRDLEGSKRLATEVVRSALRRGPFRS